MLRMMEFCCRIIRSFEFVYLSFLIVLFEWSQDFTKLTCEKILVLSGRKWFEMGLHCYYTKMRYSCFRPTYYLIWAYDARYILNTFWKWISYVWCSLKIWLYEMYASAVKMNFLLLHITYQITLSGIMFRL